MNLIEDLEQKVSAFTKEVISKELQNTKLWTKRRIQIPKTPFMKIMTKEDYRKMTQKTSWDSPIPDDFYISVTFYGEVDTSLFANNFKVVVADVSPDMIEVDVFMNKVGFREEDFFTLQIGVEILCKEVL